MDKPGLFFKYYNGVRRLLARWQNDRQIKWIAGQINARVSVDEQERPVIFFNASTRLSGMSLNAGFSLIASWAVRMRGVPVVHFVCRAGMSRCMLGTDKDNPAKNPPCGECMAQSRRLYADAAMCEFTYEIDSALAKALESLDLSALMQFEHRNIPLGAIVLPSLRWALRCHTLEDNAATRYLLREYILSAWRVAQTFTALVEKTHPQAIVLFNGMTYPEATARWVAKQRKIRVITHEVGLQPFTCFFTTGEATAYPIHIPDDFDLSPEQDQRLDAYLAQRFQGNFTMAGIRFWQDIQGLSAEFIERAKKFKQIVPVFTNVIFDTSQVHANVLFRDMFAWLDVILDIIRAHPETLFVIRAHPDEMRPGKESRENVRGWVKRNKVDELPNVMFVDSLEYINSYELIRQAKFSMVYNSTIGLEASIMGAPVLCGGKARFTQYPTVYLPTTPQDYCDQAEKFLAVDKVPFPSEFQRQARRFLYYQLFRVSLPFGNFLQEDGFWKGYVRLKSFTYNTLLPQNSPVMGILADGILFDKPFVLNE